MKIFYGVQGTGNGHITRARIMAKELHAAGIDVSFQFSGRSGNHFFDMDVFGNYQVCQGLTFCVEKGQVNYLKTAYQAGIQKFFKEINELDLNNYDLVISDFEPVTAWAAKKQQKNLVGIGHQYAFKYKIPRQNYAPLAEQVLKHFAPADKSIGLHWHHFNQPILPPIIEPKAAEQCIKNKILVYLAFEDQQQVIELLAPFKDFNFYLYAPEPGQSNYDHILCRPLSLNGFQKDLSNSAGIISNSGFELASECLQLGKKILAKPLHGQMEQLANGAALTQLGYGHVMNRLDTKVIERWLYDDSAIHVTYPNTAKIIVQWIQEGMPEIKQDFIESVWHNVKVERIQSH